MFPIRDDNPSPRFPFVVLLIILLNVVVFYLQMKTTFQMGPEAGELLVEKNALVPARDFLTSRGLGGLKPYFASMFMHGGFLHILFNLWTLWIFGDNVEGATGSIRFLFFYLLCGLAAAFTHCYLNPTSTVPVVGASGAIAGVMGAYMLLFPRARIQMFTLLIFWPIFFELPAVIFLLFWFLGQLASGAQAAQMAQSAGDVGGIAFSAHIGGFIAGMILLPFFKGKKPVRARPRSQ